MLTGDRLPFDELAQLAESYGVISVGLVPLALLAMGVIFVMVRRLFSARQNWEKMSDEISAPVAAKAQNLLP
jgi:hypothetical protein